MSDNEDKSGKQPGWWVLPLGFILTGVWGVFLIAVTTHSRTCSADGTSPQAYFWSCLEPNQIGDYFAGSFAPLAFVWLVIAVFLQSYELREQRKELVRQVKQTRAQNSVTHLNFFRGLWNTEPLLRARLAVVQESNLSKIDLEPYDDVIMTYFEDLSHVSMLDQASIDHVWSFYSYYVEGYWPILKPKIDNYRININDNSYFANFEKLYNKFDEMNKERNAPTMPESYLPSFREEEKRVVLFYLQRPSD